MKSEKVIPRVLSFDVFGTVVDWFGTISNDIESRSLPVDAGDFARAWRAGYQPAMDRVRSGELPWTRIDDLHRMILDEILLEFDLDWVDEQTRAKMNLIWNRLDPWPDSVEGLTKLKSRFTICTLSNGNLSLLADMAKHGGLPWDLILSAENFKAYKPDPASYLGVCDVFSIEPTEMMMVAAHVEDLRAAQECGCQTAFVSRPLEYGPGREPSSKPEGRFDLYCSDLNDLARQLDS